MQRHLPNGCVICKYHKELIIHQVGGAWAFWWAYYCCHHPVRWEFEVLNVGEEPTMGRDNGRISQKWEHPLSFPHDSNAGNRWSSEPPAGVPQQRGKSLLKTWSYWERWHFSCWVTQLGGFSLYALAKIQATLGILFGFFLFNLLLYWMQSQRRAALTLTELNKGFHSAYSITFIVGIYNAKYYAGAEAKNRWTKHWTQIPSLGNLGIQEARIQSLWSLIIKFLHLPQHCPLRDLLCVPKLYPF